MRIIGHRGARGLAPENTILGLQKALEHDVDELEFDVRVTKDNVPVLLHDTHASDAAGNKLRVADTTYAELKAHKPDLATLEEVFEQIGKNTPLLIEVKPNEPTGPIIKLITQYLQSDWKPDSFLLGSFSQRTLRELHEALPEIEKVVIERWSGVRASIRARQVHTKRLNMKQLWLWSGFLSSMHRRGYKIAAYTLNDPIKAKKWARYGLYAVVTDYPDRFEK